MNYANLLVTLLLSLPIASYAAGECSKFKGFVATQIGEGTKTYKTSKLSNREWPEKKCQIRVITKLEDTVTLGKFNQNGLLACQAVYSATDAETGLGYTIKSTPFAITVSDSGKPLDALYSEVPIDDVRSAMKAQYRPQPFTIQLSNEGAYNVGSAKNCFIETKPID